jgi:hypothetical protein
MPYGLPLDLGATLPPEVMDEAAVVAFEACVNSTWDMGLDSRQKTIDDIAAIVADLQNTLNTPTMNNTSLAPATVVEPLVNIPSSITSTDIYDEFEEQYTELVTLLDAKFTSFRAAFFPTENATYTLAENWLAAAIANPNVGLPPTIAAQIWGDDSARILADSSRAQDAIVAQFAGRRFPLPADVSASAVLQMQQKTQDLQAESSRKIAIMSVEMQKWLVEKILGLREMAMKSVVDYVKTVAMGPEIASRLVPIGYDAQSKLISAVSQYYNARTGAAELTYKGTQKNAELTQDTNTQNLKSEMATVEHWVKALLVEAQALSQMATALFNNIHLQSAMAVNDSRTLSVQG